MNYFWVMLNGCCVFQGFSQVQLQAVEENTFMVEQREREISQIVKSIQDLNDIFKDLATMIVNHIVWLDCSLLGVCLWTCLCLSCSVAPVHRKSIFDQIIPKFFHISEVGGVLIYFLYFASVIFQGTLLDRIDYNIEQTSVRVEKGLKQLQKAEKYQKKNRKMLIILVLFVIVIIMVIVLIFIKS